MNRHKKFYLMVGLVLAIVIAPTPYAHACSAQYAEGAENGVPDSMASCSKENYEAADKKLNDVYQTCLDKLKSSNNDVTPLNVSEKKWEAERDDDCNNKGDADTNKDATQTALIFDCKTEWTSKRVDWFKGSTQIKGIENGCGG